MNRRIVFGILLTIVLVLGGGLIAASAYQAGLASGLSQGASTVAVPVVAYGYGWQPFGFGLFGFLGVLFFLFIVFGLIRAVVGWGGPGRGGWGGRGGHGHGPGSSGGPGSDGPGGWRSGPWEQHAHETFDDWHRRAHNETNPDSAPSSHASPTGA